jgi:hypothetical protein
MATRAAMVARDADVQARLDRAVLALALRVGIELPPAPIYARDPYFRQIDERERMAVILERLLGAGIMADRFSVVNDQSGDARDVSLEDFKELQAQGYRLVDIAGYQAAMAQGQGDATPPENPGDEQQKADADYIARQTFPAADAGDDDDKSGDAPVNEQSFDGGPQDNASDGDDRTVAQLREDLEAAGVEAPKDARKADLQALAAEHGV